MALAAADWGSPGLSGSSLTRTKATYEYAPVRDFPVAVKILCKAPAWPFWGGLGYIGGLALPITSYAYKAAKRPNYAPRSCKYLWVLDRSGDENWSFVDI